MTIRVPVKVHRNSGSNVLLSPLRQRPKFLAGKLISYSSRNGHTYTNLVYDLAHHESPIAQWSERPTGILNELGELFSFTNLVES